MLASPMPMMPPAHTEMPAFLTLSRVSSRSYTPSPPVSLRFKLHPPFKCPDPSLQGMVQHSLHAYSPHGNGTMPTSYFLELVILL